MEKKSAKKKRAAQQKWLVFVDTNILLDFYRLGGESARRQLGELEKHKGSIITSEQVRMEFLKNRQKVIIDNLKNLKRPSELSFPAILADYRPSKMLRKQIGQATANYEKVRKKLEQIIQNPWQFDPVFQALNRIFDHESPRNLKRPHKVRFEIRNLARKRFVLGYPPGKQGDTSIGDALNWEWVIRCAQESTENHNILLVSRDTDYGISSDSGPILNDWLRREFKERVSRKRKVELTNKLTLALKRLAASVTPEDEREESKLISQPPQTALGDMLSKLAQEKFVSRLLFSGDDVRNVVEASKLRDYWKPRLPDIDTEE